MSRHGLAQRPQRGTRRAFRKRPGDAGGPPALHPLHARQQNNIGSIGRRMDSPAAAPPSPREDGATATPPRRSPPRVSAPPLRHRRDHPEYHHPAALLSPHGAYAAAPVSRFLQRFECRFCCLRVAAACTRALARARPILFFRVPPRFATFASRPPRRAPRLELHKVTPKQLCQRKSFSDVVVTSVVAIDCTA